MKASSSRRPEQVAETLRQVITDGARARGARPARRVRDGDRRAGDQRSLARPGHGERARARRPTQTGRSRGCRARRASSASRAARALTDPHGARAPLRARPRAGARGADQRAARRRSGGRSRTDRRGARGQAGGLTSHDVVQRVRRVLGTRAVGHTGTLDPFATGLLVVLVGRATRLARFVEAQPKTLSATARLGVATDTDDLTGSAAGRAGRSSGSDRGRRAARRWRRSWASSASGRRATRPSTSTASGATGWRGAGGRWSRRTSRSRCMRSSWCGWTPPDVGFRATVSAGTYVRALARDLGERLGVGAHLTALRREAIGALRVEDAVPLDRLDAGARPARPRGASGTCPRRARRGRADSGEPWPGGAGAAAESRAATWRWCTRASWWPWRAPTTAGSGRRSCWRRRDSSRSAAAPRAGAP